MEKNIRTAKSAKWNKGVSRKFYAQICQQVSSVSGFSKDVDADKLMRYLDDYIATGKVPSDLSDIERVIFIILQPQIDKGVIRSRLARERAMRRREAQRKGAQLQQHLADCDVQSLAAGKSVVADVPLPCSEPPRPKQRHSSDKRSSQIYLRYIPHL